MSPAFWKLQSHQGDSQQFNHLLQKYGIFYIVETLSQSFIQHPTSFQLPLLLLHFSLSQYLSPPTCILLPFTMFLKGLVPLVGNVAQEKKNHLIVKNHAINNNCEFNWRISLAVHNVKPATSMMFAYPAPDQCGTVHGRQFIIYTSFH